MTTLLNFCILAPLHPRADNFPFLLVNLYLKGGTRNSSTLTCNVRTEDTCNVFCFYLCFFSTRSRLRYQWNFCILAPLRPRADNFPFLLVSPYLKGVKRNFSTHRPTHAMYFVFTYVFPKIGLECSLEYAIAKTSNFLTCGALGFGRQNFK